MGAFSSFSPELEFADVVELIAVRHLDGSFSRDLHKSLRKTFRELVRHVGKDA